MERVHWSNVSRPRLSRRRLIGAAAASGVAAGLAACGTSKQPSGQQAGSSGASPGQPVSDGTFRLPIAASPTAWDPYLNTSITAQEPWGYVSNRVLKYKAGPDVGVTDIVFEPDVAASMPEQPDPLTVTVKLRPDVRFHDRPPLNGRQMISKDIGFAYDRYLAVGQAKNMLDMVDHYETPDDLTITFKLKRPSASFMSNLAAQALLWIIPHEVPGSDGKVGPQGPFIGAGPFVFDKYDTDVQTSFNKNPNYFLRGMPYVDRVERPILSDEATLDAQFRSGKISAIQAVESKERLAELTKSVPRAGIQKYYSRNWAHIDMAMDRPPFNDLRVRQAFSMAVDRDGLAAGLGFMGYEYCSQALPASYKPYWLDPRSPDFGENAKYYKYNLDEAKKLLAAAGHADGFETPYHYTTEYPYAKTLAELLFAQVAKAGIKLKLTSYTYTDYQNRFKIGSIEKRRYDGLVDDRPADFADPGGYFTTYWGPTATRVLSVWDDKQLQEMIDQEEVELDNQKRIKLIQDLQRYLAGGMNGVSLLTPQVAAISQPQVKNFFYKIDYGHAAEMDLRLWLTKK